MPAVRIIGGGRAGTSFAGAFESVGWTVLGVLGRSDSVRAAGTGADLVLITTPDGAVREVSDRVGPTAAVVAHAAGALGLEVLSLHEHRCAIHPLISLPNAAMGTRRLLGGGWFGIAGDRIASEVVEAFGGRWFEVADRDRARYHAAACVAANHVVALLGQVERLADTVGVPSEAYFQLARDSVANAIELGAVAALTGPAARGDDATIARHLDALPADEVATYRAGVREARRLAGRGEDRP